MNTWPANSTSERLLDGGYWVGVGPHKTCNYVKIGGIAGQICFQANKMQNCKSSGQRAIIVKYDIREPTG